MATRLRGGGEDPLEYDEYGLEHEDEHLTLIELSSGGRRGASGRAVLVDSSSPGGGSSALCRCTTVVFLLALAGVYHMGLQHGKNDANGEVGGAIDVKERVPWREEKVLVGTTTGGGPAPSFTVERLRATREEALKVVTMLDEYYSGKDRASRMLIDSWMDPWDFEDPGDFPERCDRAAKLVDTIARALVTDDQRTFLVGGIGSSVMAGHDNCHHDSYQNQMERLWRPVWEAAGMDFAFQNAGEGGGAGTPTRTSISASRRTSRRMSTSCITRGRTSRGGGRRGCTRISSGGRKCSRSSPPSTSSTPACRPRTTTNTAS